MKPKPARKGISKTMRFEVFKRDSFTCQYCGAHPPGVVLNVDHIVAVARGGKNDPDNYVTACQPCNLGKGVRDLTVVPVSLADKASDVAEREAQLIGYQSIMQARRDRLADESWIVLQTINGPECNDVPQSDYQSVRSFVEKLGLYEVLASADYALQRNARNPFRYFCGVCWSKVRELHSE